MVRGGTLDTKTPLTVSERPKIRLTDTKTALWCPAVLAENPLAVLGALHNNYHGEALTTTDEAWKGEIGI